ncbi:hypothetical protein SUDANB95_02113 [Actinosynnema sp. ALI-1.44]
MVDVGNVAVMGFLGDRVRGRLDRAVAETADPGHAGHAHPRADLAAWLERDAATTCCTPPPARAAELSGLLAAAVLEREVIRVLRFHFGLAD